MAEALWKGEELDPQISQRGAEKSLEELQDPRLCRNFALPNALSQERDPDRVVAGTAANHAFGRACHTSRFKALRAVPLSRRLIAFAISQTAG